MAELPQLTLAFLQQQPASAARAIEVLEPEDAAELLKRVPVRIGAPVFESMNSVAASRCVALLPAASAAALCDAVPWADSSALLRQLALGVRDAVLEQLPASSARRFRRSLDYAESAVGAWVDMNTPSIVRDRTVSEAVRLLSTVPSYAASHLLLTDQAQKYAGMVPLAALLRSAPDETLEGVSQRDCRAVRDSASIATVASSGDWEATSLLPVVNHRGELIGGLSRDGLGRALRRLDSPASTPGSSLLAHLLDTYLVAGEGLFRLLSQPRPAGTGTPTGRNP
jgi:Mg/Co/Ni transporter MgtE